MLQLKYHCSPNSVNGELQVFFYPIKACLVDMEKEDVFDIDAETHKFCVSCIKSIFSREPLGLLALGYAKRHTCSSSLSTKRASRPIFQCGPPNPIPKEIKVLSNLTLLRCLTKISGLNSLIKSSKSSSKPSARLTRVFGQLAIPNSSFPSLVPLLRA